MPTDRTILVVDDDSLVLESILLLLSTAQGRHTIPARGAVDATAHLQGSRGIDMMIVDIVLAGPVSGLDLCRTALALRPDMAIVVITADTEVHPDEVPHRGVFLRKPFGAEALLGAIDQAAARRTAALEQGSAG